MKNQTIGVEIEMTGLTRRAAAVVVADHLNGDITETYNSYRTIEVTARNDRRVWKLMYDGSIRVDGGEAVELVTPILNYDDIATLQEIVRKLRKAGAKVNSSCGIHIHIGVGAHTPKTLKNLVNIMVSKEDLIYNAVSVENYRIGYCKKVNSDLVRKINIRKPRNMSELAAVWYQNAANDGMDRIRTTGHYNSSRYHGLNLHSVFTKGTIEFRMFNSTLHAGKLRAYIVLAMAASHQALTQKSASPKRVYTDNEKYSFRCWLLRLGLSGDEFKNVREHLMANLTGNSAWRHAA